MTKTTGPCVALVAHPLQLTRGNVPQDFANHALLGTARSTSSKEGVHVEAYPNVAVGEVCSNYLELCRRFADDFVHEHAHLLPNI